MKANIVSVPRGIGLTISLILGIYWVCILRFCLELLSFLFFREKDSVENETDTENEKKNR